MRRNVVAADKAVNDNNAGSVYSRRYAVLVTTAARPYHHGNLREALLRAGEQALEAGGAQNLSLRELAREVGVSHAAPRRHFPDKQALLDALALNGWERLGAALATAVADAGDGFDARMLGLARAYVAFATRHPALVELMFATKHADDASPELAQAGERAFAPALATVADGQAAGAVVAWRPPSRRDRRLRRPPGPRRPGQQRHARRHAAARDARRGRRAAGARTAASLNRQTSAVRRRCPRLRPR